MKLFYKFVLTLAQTLARQLRFSINAIAPIPRPPKTAMGKIVCNEKNKFNDFNHGFNQQVYIHTYYRVFHLRMCFLKGLKMSENQYVDKKKRQ